MEFTRSNRPRQADPSKVRAGELYTQIPDRIAKRPPSERVAAGEVWSALHRGLRMRPGEAKRVPDEALIASEYLSGRKVGFARKGLRTLAKMGLIEVRASGSRRDVRIVAKLAGAKESPPAQEIAPAKPAALPRKSRASDGPMPIGTVLDFIRQTLPGYQLDVTRVTPNRHPSNG